MRTPASVNTLPGSGASDPGWATTACLRGPTAAQHAYWTTSAFVAVALAFFGPRPDAPEGPDL